MIRINEIPGNAATVKSAGGVIWERVSAYWDLWAPRDEMHDPDTQITTDQLNMRGPFELLGWYGYSPSKTR